MKKILGMVFTAFLVLSITSCDECVNCQSNASCSTEKLAEKAGESECLAEDFIRSFGCPNMGCFSNDPDISTGDRRACTFIDCETLSCDDLRLTTFFPEESIQTTEVVSGLIADISVDEMSGLPMGVFLVDDLQSEFTCGVAVP